jgi:membrane protein implicated in regulation of membrane protease activity
MKESVVDFCPVPREQQPIHEYEELKDSWFFGWATLEFIGYQKKILWVFFWCWSIAAPIVTASFHPTKFPLKFLICSTLGACFLAILVVLRLYLGWSYVRDRLKKDRIFYEESGWYDGQTWLKPRAMVDRDRLVVNYQIKPILERLRNTCLFLAVLGIFNGLIWLFLR